MGARATILLVAVAAVAGVLGYRSLSSSSASARIADVVRPLPGTVWPVYGQAAVAIGQSAAQAGPKQHPAPIASVAKVMTAYLVLRDHPLRLGEAGPTIALTDFDVEDTNRRRHQEESIVPVAAGEQLTELQALQARSSSRPRTTSRPCSRGGAPDQKRDSSSG